MRLWKSELKGRRTRGPTSKEHEIIQMKMCSAKNVSRVPSSLLRDYFGCSFKDSIPVSIFVGQLGLGDDPVARGFVQSSYELVVVSRVSMSDRC